jgi:hypothetical protein
MQNTIFCLYKGALNLGGDTSCVFGGPTCDGGVFLGGLFTS